MTMQGHVTDERWMDVIEGTATSAETAHVESCVMCGEMFRSLREGLAVVRSAEVPEPSPLYWQALRRNLGERIGSEGVRSASLLGFFGWRPALGSLAVLALIAALLPAALPRDPQPTSAATLPAWNALPPADEDEGLAVLQAMDAEEDDLAGVASSSVTGLVNELSEAESQALLRALRSGLAGRSS